MMSCHPTQKKQRVSAAQIEADHSSDAACAALTASRDSAVSITTCSPPFSSPCPDFTRYHTTTLPSAVLPSASSPPVLPVQLWGLEPLYFSCLKLLISHVLRLPAFPHLPGSARLLSHPVQKVEVVGVVVGREVREKYTSYAVDDSSGVLRCKLWHSGDADTRPPVLYTGGVLCTRLEALQLGTTVRCMGRLQLYAGERELTLEALRVEDEDEAAEMLHWLECMQLYHQVYAKQGSISTRHQRDSSKMQQQQQTLRISPPAARLP
jgi:hypothetical protein